MKYTYSFVVDALKELSPEERSRLLAVLDIQVDADRVEDQLSSLRSGDGCRNCPHCGSRKTGGHGSYNGGPRWSCKDCGRTFTAFTGTALDGIHDKGEFLRYLRSLVEGLPLREAAERHGICLQTSFDWRHRLMEALSSSSQPEVLGGEIEADELYVPHSCKGSPADLVPEDRKPRKRGSDRSVRGLGNEQVCVVTAYSGGGLLLVAAKRGKVDGASVMLTLGGRTRRKPAHPDTLITDGEQAYAALADAKNMKRELVDSKTRKSPGGYHIQHVNSAHSRLRKWMRRFNGVASKYLQRYLDYFLCMEKAKGLLSAKVDKVLGWVMENTNVNMGNVLKFA